MKIDLYQSILDNGYWWVISLLASVSILLFCLFSPNVVYIIHRHFFNWKITKFKLSYLSDLNGISYDVYFGKIKLGMIQMDVDGYYHMWFDENTTGFVDSWVLLELGEKMNQLNKPYDDSIKKYTKKNKGDETIESIWS